MNTPGTSKTAIIDLAPLQDPGHEGVNVVFFGRLLDRDRGDQQQQQNERAARAGTLELLSFILNYNVFDFRALILRIPI